MALTATIYRWQVSVSNVDRGVYEALDLRLACHPSENLRYLITRALGYCRTKGHRLQQRRHFVHRRAAHLDCATRPGFCWHGSTSARRGRSIFHKATEAAPRCPYSPPRTSTLRKGAGAIHKAASIQVFSHRAGLVAALEARAERNLSFELTEGHLYVTVGSETLTGSIEQTQLADEDCHDFTLARRYDALLVTKTGSIRGVILGSPSCAPRRKFGGQAGAPGADRRDRKLFAGTVLPNVW